MLRRIFTAILVLSLCSAQYATADETSAPSAGKYQAGTALLWSGAGLMVAGLASRIVKPNGGKVTVYGKTWEVEHPDHTDAIVIGLTGLAMAMAGLILREQGEPQSKPVSGSSIRLAPSASGIAVAMSF